MVSQWDLGQVIAKLHLQQFKAQKVPSLVQQTLVRATSSSGAASMQNGQLQQVASGGMRKSSGRAAVYVVQQRVSNSRSVLPQ
jgi:hypothetical protein